MRAEKVTLFGTLFFCVLKILQRTVRIYISDLQSFIFVYSRNPPYLCNVKTRQALIKILTIPH